MSSFRMLKIVCIYLLSLLIYKVFQENGDLALEYIGLDIDLLSSVHMEDFKRVWR